MDTTFSSEDLAFQKEVRDFIANNYPQSLRDSIAEKKRNNEELSREDLTTWHKILKVKCWALKGSKIILKNINQNLIVKD